MEAKLNIYKYATFILALLLIVVVVAVFFYNSGLNSNTHIQTTITTLTSTNQNTANSTTTSTTPFVINGTTTIGFVVCTTTIPPRLWMNTTTVRTTTVNPPTQCYTNTLFYCLYPVYSSTTGNLSVETGQDTGANWTNVYFAFVPQGTQVNNGIPDVSFASPHAVYLSNVYSGFGYNINLPISSQGTSVGTKMSGGIWAKYMVSGNSTQQYLQITTITMQAVSTTPSTTTTHTTSTTTTTIYSTTTS